MTVEIIEALRKLNERELLSYWINGEYEEARIYAQLAERAEELGLPEEVVETFKRLGEESKGHGDDLYRTYVSKYGEELLDVRVPNVESAHVVGRFWKVEDLGDVLRNAMDAEKLAEVIYRHLAEEATDEDVKEAYLLLADMEVDHYGDLKKIAERLGIDVE